MEQFISPQVLMVNGAPAICECEGNIVCWACVQANLILWDREEHVGEARAEKLCQEIQKIGVRRVAKNLGARHQTVMGWVKSKKINPSKLAFVERVVATLGLVSCFQESAPLDPHK